MVEYKRSRRRVSMAGKAILCSALCNAPGGRDWATRMLNPAPLKVGLTIPVSFDLAKAHLFSIEDGRTIAATEG